MYGGSAIASGGFGCVFNPSIKCKNKKTKKNHVSKLMLTKLAEDEIKDSKKLSRKKRNKLRHFIEENAIDFSVSFINNKIIDDINIFNATQLCMHKALDNLNTIPELILVDGNKFNPYYYNNNLIENICIIKGDNYYKSIAAASILAKCYRDEYIEKLCSENTNLNNYDLLNNKGYGTQKHLDGLRKYGLLDIHRKTFGICKEFS